MKITYLLNVFPVYSETFIVRELRKLRDKGFDIQILSMASSKGRLPGSVIHKEAEELIKKTIYYKELRTKKSKLKPLYYHMLCLVYHPVRYFRTFIFSILKSKKTFDLFKKSSLYAGALRKSRADHIHAHFALDSSTMAMLLSMMTGIPYSFTIHAHDIFVNNIANILDDKINRAKFVVCISEFNKKYIKARHENVISDKIKIVRCGVDLNEMTPATKKRPGPFFILAVGRLHEQKGFIHLIEALAIINKSDQLKFKCDIIGEGGERHALEALISKHQLSRNVRLLGAREQGETLERLSQADLFVLPCIQGKNGHMDGIPVALMEAMALQIPVVSTEISGIPELIQDGVGLLIKPKDSQALAAAVLHIAGLTEEKRKSMGVYERSKIEKSFNLDREVEKLGELFMGVEAVGQTHDGFNQNSS